jgi:type IV secretion system protein VirB9
MTFFRLISFLFVGVALWSQQQQAITPTKPAMTREAALQRAAGYNAALAMLGAQGGVVGPGGQQPGVVNPPPAAPAKGKNSKTLSAAEPLALMRTAPLPVNVRSALMLTDAAFGTDPQAKPGPDGRVIYTFGGGIAPIVCALLQVTEIDLEPGEHSTEKDVDVGDDEFHISVHKGGDRAAEFDYLIIKPTVANVETTLTVGTNKRVYYFRLIATQREHIARIAFTYPEEEARRRKEAELAKKAEADEAVRLEALAPNREMKNWKYSLDLRGKQAHYMVPVSVADNGLRTEIQLSQQVRKLGLPAFEITGAAGPIPANSHWEENKLIVDALFDRGCLLQGVGKNQQKVCIHNDADKKEAK